jgi:MFS family permease
MLHRFGARLWISRILFTWGVISAAMSLVNSAWSFYALRFTLGIAEAGLFPGVLYYLTLWYPRHRRATITSLLYLAVPIAGLSGSLLSGLIISELDAALRLAGWQWMFILEALPAILLAPVVFFGLPDRLETASWLSVEEKRRLARNLADDEATAKAVPALHVLSSLPVWHLGLILFAFVLAMYGVFFFLPTMIHAAGVATPLQVGIVTAIPYAFSIVMMIAVSRSSDRSGERRWHLIGASLVGAVGIIASVVGKGDVRVVVIGMCLAVGGIMTVLPVFWSLATGAFRGASEATAIAFINSIGLTAGFVGPSIIGVISRWSGSIDGGMLLLALVWLAGGVLVFAYHGRARNAQMISSVSPLAGD